MEALVESCCASSDVARSSDSASIIFSDRPVQHEDQDDGNQNKTATCESLRLVSIASNLQTGTPKFRRDRDVGGSTMQARFPLWKIFNRGGDMTQNSDMTEMSGEFAGRTPKFRHDRDVGRSMMQARFPL